VLLDPLAPAEQRMSQLRVSVGAFILVSLCLLPIFVRDAIRFSHRFVGPIIRLQSEMRKVDEVKELRTFKLRDKDFWQDLAGDYNDFVERLKNCERAAELERSAGMIATPIKGGVREEVL
jgi:nitrogen fixation/metabolism regulation signal transduction histidine kinase